MLNKLFENNNEMKLTRKEQRQLDKQIKEQEKAQSDLNHYLKVNNIEDLKDISENDSKILYDISKGVALDEAAEVARLLSGNEVVNLRAVNNKLDVQTKQNWIMIRQLAKLNDNLEKLNNNYYKVNINKR